MSCVSTPSISEHEIDSANLYHTPPMSSTPYTSVDGTPFSRMGGVIRPAQISSYRHARMCRERGGSGFSWRSGAACSQRQTVPRAIVLSICLSEAVWGPRSDLTGHSLGRVVRPRAIPTPPWLRTAHRFMRTAGFVLLVSFVQCADFASDAMVRLHAAPTLMTL